jgi:hypothetical protein
MQVNPHQDSPERAERRRSVLLLAGVLLAGLGVWLLVQSVFNPNEYCNAFRCVTNYETADIMGGVLVVALGSTLAWVNRHRP